jgi:hypothetical protein
VSITVSVSTVVQTGGLERLIARLASGAIEHIVSEFAEKIAETARQNAPSETGELKASIRAVLDGMSARIIAGEGLPDGRALFQELGFRHFGSGRWVQNAFLTPAFEQHRAAFIAAIVALVKG